MRSILRICLVGFALLGTQAFGDEMSSRDIVIDLKLNVAPSKAWALWTEASQVESWLTTKANVNPVLGGDFELFWDPSTPDQNSTKGCKITSIVPGKLLAFEWKGPVPFADIMNVAPLPTWASVSFEPIGENETMVHFRHSGWGSSDRWIQARKWQENAWRMAFAELDKVLSK